MKIRLYIKDRARFFLYFTLSFTSLSKAQLTLFAAIRGLGLWIGLNFVAVRESHAGAIVDTGAVKCWGPRHDSSFDGGSTRNFRFFRLRNS